MLLLMLSVVYHPGRLCITGLLYVSMQRHLQALMTVGSANVCKCTIINMFACMTHWNRLHCMADAFCFEIKLKLQSCQELLKVWRQAAWPVLCFETRLTLQSCPDFWQLVQCCPAVCSFKSNSSGAHHSTYGNHCIIFPTLCHALCNNR